MSFVSHIQTVTGSYKLEQSAMKQFLAKRFDTALPQRKFAALLRENSIETKYSVLPDFTHETLAPRLFKLPHIEPSTADRMDVYKTEAIRIATKACEQTLEQAQLNPEHITHIVTVSCTGMSAPGIEMELIKALNLPNTTVRHTVNFMGCYAAFHGFRLADMICKTHSNAKVLFVCVELCTLHFRLDGSDDNLLSTYLFGDGAAACLFTAQQPNHTPHFKALSFHSTLIPEAENDMAWSIGNNGFEMVLTREIPKHIAHKIGGVFENVLDANRLNKSDISLYAIHPGGKNILKAFETGIGVNTTELQVSYDVLKHQGNMSSATILYVLKNTLHDTKKGKVYSAAFGPGLSVESALFEKY